ncbi:Histone-lysine N-methyltransferase SETMAR [Eumeta japonica]|uniref:Histone-lysine N-methyltransferase SETMAR n=1 Tax=Eumeta variegata TaxID=151549 RepID=A0A4C1T4Y3_EUMVA|nr:Histone-lysine N-methyltransferase SETMAR [Eumeta japonica]
MRKLSARWVPRLLTLDHKRNRVTTSKECLAMFSRNPDEFLRRFVTVDETWIHHNTPETKEQSKQWVSRGERGPKKAKQSLSANKVMATVFWDARGVIHIDYLEKGKTITSEYYSKLLDRFDVDLKQKQPHLAKKKVLFHQDNARVHTCLVTIAKIHELRYELLPHPAYSPDLDPCDYYLFLNLKKWLGGKRFESNEEVITETNAYFESLEKTYYLEGIKKLEKRWTNCIELKVAELGGLARRAAGCSSAFSAPSPSAHHDPGYDREWVHRAHVTLTRAATHDDILTLMAPQRALPQRGIPPAVLLTNTQVSQPLETHTWQLAHLVGVLRSIMAGQDPILAVL